MVKTGIALGAVLILALAAWTGFVVSTQADPFAGFENTLEPKAWPDSPDAVTFAVIGDAGTGGTGQFRVAREMAEAYKEQPFSLLLTAGDNVYGGDVVDRAPDVIDKPYKPLFDAGVEFHPALGNHDVDDSDDLAETLSTLGMPHRYYHFTDGPVDFLAVDSNRVDGRQIEWLRERLICSDSLWQVVYFHHPLYSSGKHGSDTGLRQVLEPVLIEGGADIVLTGHDHDYQRSTPQHGVVHVVTGGGGVVPMSDRLDPATSRRSVSQYYTSSWYRSPARRWMSRQLTLMETPLTLFPSTLVRPLFRAAKPTSSEDSANSRGMTSCRMGTRHRDNGCRHPQPLGTLPI